VTDAAHYHQFSMEQTYALSKRTAFYALEAYQKASGKTLRTVGGVSTVVNAVASVGDSQNGTPSNGPSQFVGMVGIRHSF
jgi:predicted porin